MDVGAQLRRAREERDLSLSDLSQITKIRVALLKKQQRNLDDLGRLLRVRLRAYAAAVGLNPEEILREGLAQEAETSSVRRAAPGRLKRAGLGGDAPKGRKRRVPVCSSEPVPPQSR